MRKSLLALATVAMTISSSLASAEKLPVSLPRVGQWEVNYDVDSCHLFGRFGTGRDETFLKITQTSPSDMFRIEIFNKALASRDIVVPVKISFDPQIKPLTRNGVTMVTGKEKLPLVMLDDLRLDGWDTHKNLDQSPPAVSADRAAQVTSITFKFPNLKPYRLETGSLAVPMQAMRTCAEDLVKSWGFDPAVQASLTQRATPTGSPSSWIRDEDFPQKALRTGHNGLIQFRLDVAETGKVFGCRVLFRTDPDDFADRSCQLLTQRAKFRPALDSKGLPVKSFYIGRIRWQAGGDW